MDTSHLKRQGRRYYARIRLSAAQRQVLKRSEILRALHTQDVAEANRRKHAVLAALHSYVDAEMRRAEGRSDAGELIDAGEALAAAVRQGTMTEAAAEAAHDSSVDRYLSDSIPRYGIEPATGDVQLPASELRKVRASYAALSGNRSAALLDRVVSKYVTEKRSSLSDSSVKAIERDVKRFTDWIAERPDWDGTMRGVTRQHAGEFTGSLAATKRAPRTVKGWIGTLSSLWNWALVRGPADVNVWHRIGSTLKASTHGTQPRRRAWTDAEILTMLSGLPKSDSLFPLAAIAAYSGMRLDEIAALRTADCADGALVVREGKSQAALRSVPVHPALAPLIEQLRATSPDTYLIPHLLRSGQDAKRSKLEGKRFATALDSLGLSDPGLVFHTLRNTFMQRCEEAGVAEKTTQLIVGHKRTSTTYGTYSKGPSFAKLQAAVALVTYGAADEYLKGTAGDVRVTRKPSRRRKARRGQEAT